MKTAYGVASLALLLACVPESDPVAFELQAHSFKNSEWSQPVNLGPTINTAANENNATLSPDGLSLYFASNRAGGLGGVDIWVARRACDDCAWEAPVNLGPPINTASNDNGPSISIDGHLLFFFSTRDPAGGAGDIYLSRRANPRDDFGWGAPVALGPEVNTPGFEAGPEYLQSAEDGAVNLYFGRAITGVAFNMYQVPITRDGEVRGPAVLIPELGPGTGPTVRTDGREVLFFSSRPGTLGLQDLLVSTRGSVHEPWSTPENLGTPMNTALIDRHPALSRDARTLILASSRPGGFGAEDIWMATRTVNGK